MDGLSIYNNKVITYTRLSDGLVGYWPMNGNSNDLIGGNNGTDIGNTYVVGKVGQCSSFDGSSYIANIGTGSSYSFIQNTGIFTLSFWVKFNDYTSVPQYFMGNTGTTIEKGFFIGSGVLGDFEIAIVRADNSHFVLQMFPSSFFSSNDWYHIALVGNGTKTILYRNSQYFTEANFSTFSSGDSTRELEFGKIGGFAPDKLNGYLDEIAIWNRTLATNEVKRLYNGGRGFKLL